MKKGKKKRSYLNKNLSITLFSFYDFVIPCFGVIKGIKKPPYIGKAYIFRYNLFSRLLAISWKSQQNCCFLLNHCCSTDLVERQASELMLHRSYRTPHRAFSSWVLVFSSLCCFKLFLLFTQQFQHVVIYPLLQYATMVTSIRRKNPCSLYFLVSRIWLWVGFKLLCEGLASRNAGGSGNAH